MSAHRREYFQALVAHGSVLWDAVDSRLAAAGAIRPARLFYMRVVRAGQQMRIQDIASRLAVTVGAASRLTDRLVADGFVVRMPNPEDRRSCLVTLTGEGERSLLEAEVAFDRALEEILGDVGEAELASLTGELAVLTERLTPLREAAQ